jgi:hypothetical protein
LNLHTYIQNISFAFITMFLSLAWFNLQLWRWKRYISPKSELTFNGAHGVISQKTELLITTAVRTSNPATTFDL